MSREIMRFCKDGFIERVNRVDYRVQVLSDFRTAKTRIGRNSNTRKLNDNAALLGGTSEPSERNGWFIEKYIGQCSNHENEYLLTSRYYDGYWKAYLTGNADKYGTEEYSGFGFKAVNVGDVDPDRWCDEINYVTPEEVAAANRDSNPNLSFLNDNRTELTAAAVVVAIVLIVVIVRA